MEGYSELVDIATTDLSRTDTLCTLSHIDRESYGSKGKVKVFWIDDLLLALRQVKFLYEWVRGKSIQNLLTKGKGLSRNGHILNICKYITFSYIGST